MAEILIPVGPSDKPDWVKRSIESALSQPVSRVVIYNNSEREDLTRLIEGFSSPKVSHVIARRMKEVNMARLRNEMAKYASEDYVIMLDSDVVIPFDWSVKLIRKLEEGVAFTWMHYAYDEAETTKPLAVGEENPNLGCAGLNLTVLRQIGMFDERYARDEDIWLYSYLKRKKYRVEPSEGRCLHLNKVHARNDLKSSLKEARRNLWRSKYDMMLVFDGLVNLTFLTGYAYYGSYYAIALLTLLERPLALMYLPLVGFGIYYYRGVKRFFYNLIPGLALAGSLPYGVLFNIYSRLIRRR
ncbi:MAG: glycosyltransferase family 2 protein [Thermoprotei archaeon]